MRRMKDFIRGLSSLVTFLTILPIGTRSIEKASGCLYCSPLVGLIIGAISWVSFKILAFIDAWIASITFIIFMYFLSGLLHLDGFIDFADVLSVGATGSEAVRILKDPHKGGKGIAYTILLIIFTFLVYMRLLIIDDLASIVALISTYESLYLTALLGVAPPYSGLGSLFIRNSRNKNILNIIVYIILIAPFLFIEPNIYRLETIAAATLGSIVASVYSAKKASKHLGWVNGDVLGFSLELSRCLTGYLLLITISINSG